MAFTHGKNADFQLDDSGGTLTTINTYMDTSDFEEALETAETTAYTKDAKTYIPGLKDATVSIGGKWDATLDAHLSGVVNALAAGTLATASFVYGPAGNGTGNPKYSGEALVTSFKVSSPVGDVITWTADLQITDTVTRGTYA